MGEVTVKLGFDAKANRITIDGEPTGKPVLSRRQRLMLSMSKRAHIWASMPKPEGK